MWQKSKAKKDCKRRITEVQINQSIKLILFEVFDTPYQSHINQRILN